MYTTASKEGSIDVKREFEVVLDERQPVLPLMISKTMPHLNGIHCALDSSGNSALAVEHLFSHG